ncbi:hypothetical protein OROHE_008161 [Orobanche hederae]
MEEQWAYYYQEEGVEDMKQSLLYSTLELEAALISAHDEISRKDDEILQLKGLLTKIIKEKDESQAKCQQLVLEKQMLFRQVQVLAHSSKQQLDTCPISSGTTSNDDGPNLDMSPSDCDDSTVIAPSPHGCKDTPPLTQSSPPPTPPSISDMTDRVMLKKPLPEHGKFLQAVMEAGPLLQTLLLSGPLPRWQHPPPQLNSMDIPPVTIGSPNILSQDSCLSSGGFTTNKRATVYRDIGYDFSPSSKYHKLVHQSSSLTPTISSSTVT